MSGAVNLHASTVVLGEGGVLIRGPSGAGKTALALALVERARASGGFGRLVADDRTLVVPHGVPHGGGPGGRLVARPHPALAGRVERRGLGIGAVEHEAACVVRLVVDLIGGPPDRLPEPGALRCDIAGVVLSRIALPAGPPTLGALDLVASALSEAGSPAAEPPGAAP